MAEIAKPTQTARSKEIDAKRAYVGVVLQSYPSLHYEEVNNRVIERYGTGVHPLTVSRVRQELGAEIRANDIAARQYNRSVGPLNPPDPRALIRQWDIALKQMLELIRLRDIKSLTITSTGSIKVVR